MNKKILLLVGFILLLTACGNKNVPIIKNEIKQIEKGTYQTGYGLTFKAPDGWAVSGQDNFFTAVGSSTTGLPRLEVMMSGPYESLTARTCDDLYNDKKDTTKQIKKIISCKKVSKDSIDYLEGIFTRTTSDQYVELAVNINKNNLLINVSGAAEIDNSEQLKSLEKIIDSFSF